MNNKTKILTRESYWLCSNFINMSAFYMYIFIPIDEETGI